MREDLSRFLRQRKRSAKANSGVNSRGERQMDQRRIVDITFPTKGSYGSGYLITNRLVLTAKHVTGKSVLGDVCTLSLISSSGDKTPAKDEMARIGAAEPIRAELVWQSDTEDVALLSVSTPVDGIQGLHSATVGVGKVPRDLNVYDCAGIGFPDALPDGQRNQDRRVTGTLSWSFRTNDFSIDATNSVPRKAQQWAGFSGTAIFCDSLLVAVVTGYDEGYAGHVLRATPIQNFCSDPTLNRYISIKPEPVGVLKAAIAHCVASRVCLINREIQIEAVLSRLRSTSPNTTSSPVLFLIKGSPEDDHRRLIERLERDSLVQKHLNFEGSPGEVIFEIPWPKQERIDPDTAFQSLLHDKLEGALQFPVEEHSEALALRKALNASATGRGFWFIVEPTRLGSGHDVLLQRWLALWLEAFKLGVGKRILLFMCLVQSGSSTARSNLRNRRSRQATSVRAIENVLDEKSVREHVVVLDELGAINRDDVPRWINVVKNSCASGRPEYLDYLRLVMECEVGDGITMQEFSKRLTGHLKAAGSPQ
jgi:hypothetical protein